MTIRLPTNYADPMTLFYGDYNNTSGFSRVEEDLKLNIAPFTENVYRFYVQTHEFLDDKLMYVSADLEGPSSNTYDCRVSTNPDRSKVSLSSCGKTSQMYYINTENYCENGFVFDVYIKSHSKSEITASLNLNINVDSVFIYQTPAPFFNCEGATRYASLWFTGVAAAYATVNVTISGNGIGPVRFGGNTGEHLINLKSDILNTMGIDFYIGSGGEIEVTNNSSNLYKILIELVDTSIPIGGNSNPIIQINQFLGRISFCLVGVSQNQFTNNLLNEDNNGFILYEDADSILFEN